MTTAIEYALMAGASYISTRDPINRIPAPQGWTKVINPDSYFRDPSSGFEAISFTNGTEIVISFAGTNQLIDVTADLALVLGSDALQLKQAALYYENIKAAAPPGTQISFTGHSLGGGLAALMGVFFNKLAMTFDQLPVRSAASMSVRDSIASYLLANGGITDADLASFTSDIGFPNGVPPGIRGEGNISRIIVQGEAISSSVLLSLFSSIGTSVPQVLVNGGVSNTSSNDLHSQALLTAFEQDDRFRAVSLKLANLIKLIFDSALFYHDPNNTTNPERNFLEHLVRHQAGVPGSITADDMLVHFTHDMQDIVQAAGNALTTPNLNKALIAFGLQAYYEQVNAFTKEAFQSFYGDQVTLTGPGPSLYGEAGLDTLLGSLMDDTIDGGADPDYATGYLGNDTLIGGLGNDILDGDEGRDVVQGDDGDARSQADNDWLLGGTGADVLIGNSLHFPDEPLSRKLVSVETAAYREAA